MQTPSNRPQRFPVIEIQNQQMKPPPPRRADITGLSYLGNRATPRQAPLRSISSNSVNGLSGYGMSAGLKVSNATTKAQDGYRSVSRPRGLSPKYSPYQRLTPISSATTARGLYQYSASVRAKCTVDYHHSKRKRILTRIESMMSFSFAITLSITTMALSKKPGISSCIVCHAVLVNLPLLLWCDCE